MSTPRYDMVIATLTSTERHYAARLEAFARFGLLNLSNRKIKHVFLHHGPAVPPSLLESWPCEYEIIHYPQRGVNFRFCEFFTNRALELLSQTRWFAKWDDDSITDVDGLLKNLDEEFDWTDALYLMADHVPGVDPQMRMLLQKVGLRAWTRRSVHSKFVVAHEWEGSIFSSAALSRIASNARAMLFLRRNMIDAPETFGDQAMAIAARIAKIHPIDVPFMTKDDAWEDLTLFGGRHAHVHFMSPDRPARWGQFIKHLDAWRGSLENPANRPRAHVR